MDAPSTVITNISWNAKINQIVCGASGTMPAGDELLLNANACVCVCVCVCVSWGRWNGEGAVRSGAVHQWRTVVRGQAM